MTVTMTTSKKIHLVSELSRQEIHIALDDQCPERIRISVLPTVRPSGNEFFAPIQAARLIAQALTELADENHAP